MIRPRAIFSGVFSQEYNIIMMICLGWPDGFDRAKMLSITIREQLTLGIVQTIRENLLTL